MSAPRTRGCPSLQHAMGEVQRLAIAPLTRVELTRPDAMARGQAHVAFKARRLEVETQVAKDLADQGAFVAYGGEEARISYAGITATSTAGLFGAAKNWRTRATAYVGAGR